MVETSSRLPDAPTESTSGNGSIDLGEEVRALKLPFAYCGPVVAVETIETHFAWIFLAGARAYKLKKPMRIGTLDLSSLDVRAFDCHEEVRLNRRLAPDVYLGVVPLVQSSAGTLHIGGVGRTVDWLVEMRRLPQSKMLDRAIADGKVTPASLHALGILLAQFYRSQPKIPFDPDQYAARLAGQIDVDCDQLLDPALGLDASEIRSLASEQASALEYLATALGERATDGHIVEAHGDLRPEHVCLSDPPVVIDALEFSSDLRTLDALEEIAFFCLECEFAGAQWVGRQVLDAYRAASNDHFTPALCDFYCSRRAAVRSKILAWHLLDPAVRDVAPWAARAAAYIARARQYARAALGSVTQNAAPDRRSSLQ